MRHLAPVVSLLLVSPLLIEFLAGSTTLSSPWALLGYATLNGAGAVLIREAWVRRRGPVGRPGSGAVLLAFAVAYGLWEEGLLDQALFNPGAYGGGWLSFGYVPGLGTSVPVALFEIAITAVGSVLVPIGLVELAFPARRGRPWLGQTGLIVTAVVFVALGSGSTLATTILVIHFLAPPAQLIGAAVVIAALVSAGLRWPIAAAATADPTPGAVDVETTVRARRGVAPAWLIGLCVTAATGAAIELIHDDHRGWWPAWAASLLLVGLVIGSARAVRCLVNRAGWTPAHQFALLVAPVVAIAALGLSLRVHDTIVHAGEQIGLTLATATALTLLGNRVAHRPAHPNRTRTDTGPSPTGDPATTGGK